VKIKNKNIGKINKIIIIVLGLLLISGGSFGFGLKYFTQNSLASTGSFTESFTSNTYKDISNTTGFWNTRDGNSMLNSNGTFNWAWRFPMSPSFGLKINDVAFRDANNAVAATESGAVLNITFGSIASISVPQAGITRYTGVSFYDASNGFLVGQPALVLKTADGGSSWSACGTTGFTITTPTDVAVNIDGDVYVSGEGGKIAKSTDGGASWTMLTTGTTIQLNAISVGPPAWKNWVVAVGGASPAQVIAIQSNDNGSNFTDITGAALNPLSDVRVIDYMTSVAVGSDGVFTTPGAFRPLAAVAGNTGLTSPLSVATIGTDDQNFFVADSLGQVASTTDGGASWLTMESYPITHEQYELFGLDCTSTSNCLAVGSSGVRASYDGLSWGQRMTPLTASALNEIYCSSPEHCFLEGISRFIDADGAWGGWMNSPNGNNAQGMKFVSDTIGYKVGVNSDVYKTTDGTNWTSAEVGIVGTYNFTDVDFIDANNGWVVGGDGITPVIYNTAGGADAWGPQMIVGSNYITAIDMVDANVGYVVMADGAIGKTTNGGSTWTVDSSNTDPLSDIYCYDATTCWASKSIDSGTFLYTTNGTTWGTGSLAATDTINALIGLDEKTLFVSGESSIQYTTNGGSTWAAITSDYLPKGLKSIAYVNPKQLYIIGDATYQRANVLNISANYAAAGTIQSLTVDNVDDDISAATLTATEALNGGTISYEMSVDGGANWESVTSGVEHSFANTGSDLRWRAMVAGGPATTPTISEIAITYTYETAGGGWVPPVQPVEPPPVYACSDGNDNDTDGMIDYPNDPGCTSAIDNNESNIPACSDGLDNDNDSQTDFPLDPGCLSLTDDEETQECNDGIDNDNDTKVDFPDDLGCSSVLDNLEQTGTHCSDGLDNDLDGSIDYPLDLGCSSPADDDETNVPMLTIKLNHGAITNSVFPSIEGTTTTPSSLLSIFVDGVQVDTVNATALGQYTWTSPSIYLDGNHDVYVQEGTLISDKLTFKIDTEKPDEPILEPVIINSQSPAESNMAVGFSLSGNSETDVKYLMTYIDGILADINKVTESDWTLNFFTELTVGNHFVSVKALDSANNFAELIPTLTFNVTADTFYQCNNNFDDDGDGLSDLSDPDCSAENANDESSFIAKNLIDLSDAGVSNNNLPNFSGTTLEGAATVDIYVDGLKMESVVSGSDKTFVWRATETLLDGMHEIFTKVGEAVSDPVMVFIDTVAPLVPTMEKIAVPTQTLVGEDVLVEMALSGLVTSETDYVLLYLDNELIDRFAVLSDSWQYNLSYTLPVGEHTLTVRSMDEAGNISQLESSQTFIVQKEVLASCNNKLDDDGDGLADLNDPGCENVDDVTEDTDVFISSGTSESVILTSTATLFTLEPTAIIGFNKDGEDHSVQLLGVANGVANLLIASDPIKISLRLGETKRVDIDEDKVNDLEIKLIKILPGNRAVLTVKKISIKIVDEQPIEVVQKDEEVVVVQIQPDNNQVNIDNKNEAQDNQVNLNNILGALGGQNGGGGGGVPDALPPNLLNDPQIQNLAAQIGEKNEWDKSDEERQFEIIFETEEIVQNEAVQAGTELAAKALAGIFGGDAVEMKLKVENTVRKTVKTTKQVQKATVDNPTAEKVNDVADAPAMAAVTATSVASVATVGVTGAAGVNAVTYLQFALSQSMMLFVRKRRDKWGQIYNSVTKQPVDLAIVRIHDSVTNKLVSTKVTDRQGRYNLILKPGKYFIEVDKKDYKFPSTLLDKAKTDGKYENVYYGGEFEINDGDGFVRPIAVDPHKKMTTEKSLVKMYLIRKGQFALTVSGPILAVSSFIINPEWWVGGTVVAQLGLYVIFKKLGIGDKPKSWGVVRGGEKKEVVQRAIVRVFDTKFNKLLETQVTDAKGRYAFLVGNQEYYMTADKAGYFQLRTNRYNLTNETSGYLIDDLFLKQQRFDEKILKAVEEGKPVTVRTELGRQVEKEVDGMRKVVRRPEEKFDGDLTEVELEDMHEDFYAVDTIKVE